MKEFGGRGIAPRFTANIFCSPLDGSGLAVIVGVMMIRPLFLVTLITVLRVRLSDENQQHTLSSILRNSPDLGGDLINTLLTDDLLPLRINGDRVSFAVSKTTELKFDNKVNHRGNTCFRKVRLSRHDARNSMSFNSDCVCVFDEDF